MKHGCKDSFSGKYRLTGNIINFQVPFKFFHYKIGKFHRGIFLCC